MAIEDSYLKRLPVKVRILI